MAGLLGAIPATWAGSEFDFIDFESFWLDLAAFRPNLVAFRSIWSFWVAPALDLGDSCSRQACLDPDALSRAAYKAIELRRDDWERPLAQQP